MDFRFEFASKRDFLCLNILAKSDFLGSIKYERQGEFFGLRKNHRDFIWVFYFSSAQIKNKINAIYCWCGIVLGHAKKKQGFLWVDKF